MNRFLPLLLLALFVCTGVHCQRSEAPDGAGGRTEGSPSEPFFFIQLSDPQFGFMDANQSYTAEAELMERAVGIINRLRPDFVVVTGDMVNASKSTDQVAAFKRSMAGIDRKIPVYVIPGNHDISMTTDPAQLEAYAKNYGQDRFCFDHKGCRFVGINSCVIREENPDLEPEQYEWLENKLAEAEDARFRFVFSHYSFFLKTPDEADKYSNIPLSVRGKYLDLFHRYGVAAVFAGHLHDISYGEDRGMKMVTAGALGKALGKGFHGMNLVKVYPDRFTYEYIALDRFPDKVTF